MSEKQAHLNGAYYGPSIPPREKYHRPGRSGGPLGCCCSCIFGLVFKLIFTAVVFMGLAFLVFWLIVRPTRVKFHVTDAKLTQFNFSTDSNLHYNLALNLTIRNPNKKIGVYYDRIEATALYEGQRLSTVPLTPFYQGHKTTNVLNPVFNGQQLIVGSNLLEEFNQQKSAGVYEIEMKIYLRIRFKLGRIKTGKFKPRIECDLKIPLNNGNSLDRNGVEPSPIECWRKFHISKAKNGQEEHWKSEKAKKIYDDLNQKRTRVEEAFGEVNDWEIYRKVVGEPSHGRILGLGAGIKCKNVYPSPNQACTKSICLEQKEDHERMKVQVESLNEKVDMLTQIIQGLVPNNLFHSGRAEKLYSTENIPTHSSANADEDDNDSECARKSHFKENIPIHSSTDADEDDTDEHDTDFGCAWKSHSVEKISTHSSVDVNENNTNEDDTDENGTDEDDTDENGSDEDDTD